MKTGPVPAADRGAGLLAERGVRLVADHDRVGVRDVAGVAHEPLVGLDGHRARPPAVSSPFLQQRRRDAVAVAAVAQLAEELVDEVAAVGEDQDAAGARGLDEAERGDGLAGAGRVLEPEAAGGARVLAAARRRASSSASSAGSQSSGSSSAQLVALDLDLAGWAAPRLGDRRAAVARSCAICSSAVSAISVPERASTWWAESTVPSASCGSSSDEQPLEPEHQRVVAAPLDRGLARGRPRSRPARRPARAGARCPRQAPAPGPRPAARTARARIPRRARGLRRRPASLRGQSLCQPRSAYSVMGKRPEPQLAVRESAGSRPSMPVAQESPASGGRAGPSCGPSA